MPQNNMNVGRGVLLLIGIVLLAIVSSFIVPQVVEGEDAIRTDTIDMTEGEVYELTSGLDAIATLIDGNPDKQVNVTVVSTETGDSAQTGVLNEGESASITIDGETVTVTNILVSGGNLATVTFQYPAVFAWGQATTALYGSLGLGLLGMIVLYMLVTGFSILGV